MSDLTLTRFRCAVLLFVLFFTSTGLRAHDTGLSLLDARLTAEALEVTLNFETKDVRLLSPTLPETPTRAAEDMLLKIAPHLLDVRTGEKNLSARRTELEISTAGSISFRYSFERPGAASLVFRYPKLVALPSTHRVLFVLRDEAGAVLITGMLSADEPMIEVPRTVLGVPDAPVGFRAFLMLGVEHIWTGYDHLLFLFGLLLVCATFRSILAIVSCFTLGHSITLALATFDLVNAAPALVEPLIAASIVFVGVENLVRRGQAPRGRPALTMAFGLIHGFGFASVLRDLGVGADGSGYAVPLFSFNLGVELGQLFVAAIVLPVVWRLRKNDLFLSKGVPVLSALIAAAGLWWLIERTLMA